MISEYIEECRVDDIRIFYPDVLFLVTQQVLVDTKEWYYPGILHDFGKVAAHGRGHRHRCIRQVIALSLRRGTHVHPINILRIGLMPVIAVLVLYIQQDVEAAESTGGKAENIDKAKGLVLQQEPDRCFKIAFQHDYFAFLM